MKSKKWKEKRRGIKINNIFIDEIDDLTLVWVKMPGFCLKQANRNELHVSQCITSNRRRDFCHVEKPMTGADN